MVFYPPDWMPKLPEPPDTVSLPSFVFENKHERYPIEKSRPLFTCGLSGRSYSPAESRDRVSLLARGLSREFGWKPNEKSEWDKVACVFAVNTIDSLTIAWAIHRLGGIDTPANAAYSAFELEHQVRDSGAKYIFTCLPLLDTTLQVAQKLNIPRSHIYIIELPPQATDGKRSPTGFKTIDDLIEFGKSAPEIEPLRWSKGQGARQTAFLCYSSGTSGLPKGVMVSHRNVIANTMAIGLSDRQQRLQMAKDATGSSKGDLTENVLGLLPMSHIYGLVVICHASIYQGDGVVVLPKFEFGSCMKAVQDHKINQLYLVPPIIVAMTNNADALKKFDLSQVGTIFSGAAPLGPETSEVLQKMYPKWLIRQGYGLTETCTVVSSTSMQDIWYGSVGCLIPRTQARLVTADGVEVTEYDQPGELWVKSPSVVLGYLHNEEANKATFTDDGYMRTGDEAVFRKNPRSGNEHLFIVDRIKELIKVKGMQVAPAELEAHLLSHPAVADTTVIPIPDASAGERPKAFIVKSAKAGGLEDSERLVKREIMKHVEDNKARHKWLKEIEFVDAIPKSPSGKILRRLMRDREKEARRKQGAKL